MELAKEKAGLQQVAFRVKARRLPASIIRRRNTNICNRRISSNENKVDKVDNDND